MPRLALFAGLALCALNMPAMASPCSDEIAALDKRVQKEGREAISAATGSKTEAAARAGQGQSGAAGDAQPAPPQQAAQAGPGAEKAQAARVALDEARTHDGKGDTKGCAEAVERAKSNLDTAP